MDINIGIRIDILNKRKVFITVYNKYFHIRVLHIFLSIYSIFSEINTVLNVPCLLNMTSKSDITTRSAAAVQANAESAQLGNVLGELSTAIQGMRVDRVPPPVPYNGFGSAQSFFTAFEKYAKSIYDNDEQSYLQVLPTFLEGEPKAIVLSFGTTPDVEYRVVRDRVIHEMSTHNSIGSRPYTDFFSAKRLPRESLTCFCIRLEGAAKKVAMASDEARKVMVRSKFVGSLPDMMVQQMTVHLGHLNAVSLEQVVRLACILESQSGHLGVNAPQSVPAWPLNAIMSPMMEAGNQTTYQTNIQSAPVPVAFPTNNQSAPVAFPTNNQSAPVGYETNASGSMEGRKCFSCDQFGHFARNCPNKNRSRSNKTSVSCMFCGRSGHVFADCRTFKERFMQCAFCGSTEHASFNCKDHPRNAPSGNW